MEAIKINLAELRKGRDLTAMELARQVGITRQAIHRIETSGYVPNTAVALRIARALGVPVEEVFALSESAGPKSVPATLLPGEEELREGDPVRLCAVDQRLFASRVSPVAWTLPASDGIFEADAARLFDPGDAFRNRILIAGCDPAVSLLSQYLRASGIELIAARRNSSQALKLLKRKCVHVAGTHLVEPASGLAATDFAVFRFAVWEAGIITAPGNPKTVQTVADFTWPDIRLANREKGSGARALLDRELARLDVPASLVRGYQDSMPGHMAVAWAVASGQADGAIATRSAARAFGLEFLPLTSEHYDFAIHRRHLMLPGVQALLDTLSRARFRRELEMLTGYDTSGSGTRLQ